MTRILLIRHATGDHVGRRLAGREPGGHLGREGVAQARRLAGALSGRSLTAVYTSPLERAAETAEPIAAAHGLSPVVSPEFNEVDFGEWTGRAFDEMEDDPRWRAWNELRSTARPPGGEAMAEVVARALAGIERIVAEHEGGEVAVVSHCDVIRPLLMHFLGAPLDHLLRLEVAPASVSEVEVAPWGPRVLGINRGPDV